MKKHTIFLLLSLIVLSFASILAKEKKSHEIQVTSGMGREYWIAIPPNEVPNYNSNVLEFYITSYDSSYVTLESPTMGVYLTKEAYPGKITTFSSENNETTFQWEIRESERITDKGLRLTSEYPISVYVLNAKTYTSEGYRALPINEWGTEYIHCSYYDFNEVRDWAGGFIVIAAYENTKIRITLKGAGAGYAKTLGGHEIGDIISLPTMQPGQTYMVRGDGKTRGKFDLTGTNITSSKPVGLVSFHMRTIIPAYDINNGRDCLSEMLPPVSSWSTFYADFELKRDKGKGDFFRIVASEANTHFRCKYYDIESGKQLGTWEQTLHNAGDFAEWLEAPVQAGHDLKSIRGTSVFEADKPIMVMKYSYSEQWDGATIFDPFMILLTPVREYGNKSSFQTPANKSFQDNFVHIFTKADTSDPSQADLRSIKINDKKIHIIDPDFLDNKIPETDIHWARIRVFPGAHFIEGDIPVTGYIYGFSNWDSYGWPICSSWTILNETDTLAPELTYETDCFYYNVQATELRNGAEEDDPRQVDQGIFDITLLDGSYNYELVFDSPFNSWPPLYEYSFELQVIDVYINAMAIIEVGDRAGNTTVDTLYYYPDSVKINGQPDIFELVRLNTGKSADFNIININPYDVTLEDSEIKIGNYYQITDGWINGDITLAPGDTHSIEITYLALRESLSSTDKDLDTLSIHTECLVFDFPLAGRGVVPRIVVDDFHAGKVEVGKKICKSETGNPDFILKNTGSMELIITEIEGVVPPFELSDPIDPPLPIMIPPFGEIKLKEMCFNSNDTMDHHIVVTFHSNADPEGSDSLSEFTGGGIDPSGINEYVSNAEIEIRPNPVIGKQSEIFFRLVKSAELKIELLDSQGNFIREIYNKFCSAGENRIPLSLNGLASGAYFIRISISGNSLTKSFILMR